MSSGAALERGRRALFVVLPPLALAAGALVFWTTRLSTRSTMFAWLTSGDLYEYFLPSYTYQAMRMGEGSIPLWNPYQGVGQPFLAALQPGVLYPARLLLLVQSPAHAMGTSLGAHLLFLVVTTYAFARALGTTRLAASCAAIVLGATLGANWFYLPSYLEAGAWWPTLALALVRLVGGGGWRWAVLLGAAGAMPVLAGGYQVTVYMAYALGLLAAGLFTDPRFRPASWRPLALRLAVAGLVAAATAAPQLLPTFAWSAEAARRTAALTDVQLNPLGLQTPPWELLLRTLIRGSGYQPFFLSIPAIGLALLGFARQRILGLVMGAGALLLTGVALGPGSPLFPLYRALPGLAVYRLPMRLLIAVFFLVATGVALGVSACQRWRPARLPQLGPALATGAALALLAALVAPIRNDTQLPWLQGGSLRPALPVMDLAGTRVGDGRVAFFGKWFPIAPRYAMLGGMRCVQDYEPLSSRRLQHFLFAVAGQPLPGDDAPLPFTGHVGEPNPLAQPRLLDLVATRAVVVTSETPGTAPAGLVRAGAVGPAVLYANPSALPRAYLVPAARFVPSAEAALAAVLAPDFDPRREAVLVGSPGEAGGGIVAGAGEFARARITRDGAERVEIGVAATAPAVLVLADAFAPGWEALVDGRPRRLWQANHLVRGVILEPGDRHVAFVYRAPGWRLGWALCAAGWLAAAIVVSSGRGKR